MEQYHSEHFANLHLDALGRPVGLPTLDWTFGPVAFRASMARHWLQCEGELWDAQLVPIVHASRWRAANPNANPNPNPDPNPNRSPSPSPSPNPDPTLARSSASC